MARTESAVPASAGDTRQTFYDVLNDSLENGLTFEVVQTIHENLSSQLADRRKDAEPLQVSRREIASLLESCDVPGKQQEAFEEAYLEQFGAVGIEARNVVEQKKFEITTDSVTVTVDPERSDLVEMKRIDNARYILIRVEGDVAVNGVEVNV